MEKTKETKTVDVKSKLNVKEQAFIEGRETILEKAVIAFFFLEISS